MMKLFSIIIICLLLAACESSSQNPWGQVSICTAAGD